MAPKRLSEDEKREIVDLYRQPEETTSTLASRYGVSSSTISRILKQNLSASEYDALVQQKRTGSGKPSIVDSNLDLPAIKAKEPPKPQSQAAQSQPDPVQPDPVQSPESDEVLEETSATEADDGAASPSEGWAPPKLKRDRSSPSKAAKAESAEGSADRLETEKVEAKKVSDTDSKVETAAANSDSDSLSATDGSELRRRRRRSRVDDTDTNSHQASASPPTPAKDETVEPGSRSDSADDSGDEEDFDASGYQSYDLDDEDDLDDELDDDDLDDDDNLDDEDFGDLDDDDDDDDDDDGDNEGLTPILQHHDLVQVFPLSDVELPRTCYIVIDRFAELIAPPLKEFGELGKIPEEELLAKTLPIFDNHRVAKRFANRRTQRIVKVPDGRMLQKTTPYLSAKGITRLLFDGQVYSLVD